MPRVLIRRCGRCGESITGDGWFVNGRQEDCHTCADGIIGGALDAEPDDVIELPKPAEEWQAQFHCPICGIPWSRSNKQEVRLYAGNVVATRGGFRFCASCCIMCKAVVQGRGHKYTLLDIHDFYPPSNAGEVQRKSELSRVARHLAWVRSLTGLDIEVKSIAKAIAFSEGSFRKLTRPKLPQSKLDIPCADCGRTMNPVVGPNAIRVRADDKVRVEVDLRLDCPECRRRDYYLKRELPGHGTKWMWFYTLLGAGPRPRPACNGITQKRLSKQEQEAATPIVANSNAGTVPATVSFSDEIAQIAEDLAKVLSNQ